MDPKKWDMPGWRIEQIYSPEVLIGNWSENRKTVSIRKSSCHGVFLDFSSMVVNTKCLEMILSVVLTY